MGAGIGFISALCPAHNSEYMIRPAGSALGTFSFAERHIFVNSYMKYTFPFRVAVAGLALFYNEQI